MKNNKGITLIALVITIIVMLILVIVTINIAMNGDLFNLTKKAAIKTQEEIDKENLMTLVWSSYGTDGKVHFTGSDGMDNNLPDGFTGSNGRYTKEDYIYTVNEDTGEITVRNKNEATDIEKYIMGFDLNGRTINDTNNKMISLSSGSYVDFINDINLISEEYRELKEKIGEINLKYISLVDSRGGISIQDGNTLVDLYFEYNNETYKFRLSNFQQHNYIIGTTMNFENLSEKISSSNIGKTVTIGGREYIVLYDAGEQGQNAQLISKNVIDYGKIVNYIDWSDTNVIDKSDILNGTQKGTDGQISDLEKAIYIYNNLVEILNEACYNAVISSDSNILDVRSVGTKPTSKNYDPNNYFTSEQLARLPYAETNTFTPGFLNNTSVGLKDYSESRFIDIDRMAVLGIINADTDYILAAHGIDAYAGHDENGVFFTLFGTNPGIYWSMHAMEYGIGYKNVIISAQSSGLKTDNLVHANLKVRPVISISAEYLNQLLGE